MENDKQARLAHDARQRLDNFFDCLARLMAKRWLREQQDESDGGDEGEIASPKQTKEPRHPFGPMPTRFHERLTTNS